MRTLTSVLLVLLTMFTIGCAVTNPSSSNDPDGQHVRAAEGQPIAIWINRVKPDKRQQFEEFLETFWRSGDQVVRSGKAGQAEREAYHNVRFLFPSAPNDDGTFTYIFLADPFVEGANYRILDFLKLAYPEQEATRLYRMYEEALSGPQESIYVEQTRY